MMNHRNSRRGAAWGYGLGLLSLLAVVALMLWMAGKSAETYTGADQQIHSYQSALDQARSVTQAAGNQAQQQLRDALNAANPPMTTAPATPGPGTGR
jgi:type II secretory pathway pseudopilin PulG